MFTVHVSQNICFTATLQLLEIFTFEVPVNIIDFIESCNCRLSVCLSKDSQYNFDKEEVELFISAG